MGEQGRVVAVCLSAAKGKPKAPVEAATLVEDSGVKGDAHAGTPDRQVSLLCAASVRKMQGRGMDIGPGDFAENLNISGVEVRDLPIGARIAFQRGPELEVTRIGKECHAGCAIRDIIGDCAMPREGVFARVVRGGEVRPGDSFEVSAND